MTEELVKGGETYCGKRKRGGMCLADLELETERQRMETVEKLNLEMKGLVECYNLHQRSSTVSSEEVELVEEQNVDREIAHEQPGKIRKQKAPKLETLVAQLTESSDFTLSELVSLITRKLTSIPQLQSTSPALVRTVVLSMGHRIPYGISDSDADSLEDHTPSALWCWEIRDLKLLPKPMRPVSKARRAFRKSIYERITAISELIQALQKTEHHPGFDSDIIRAFDKLYKMLPVKTLPSFACAIVPESFNSRPDDEISRKQDLTDTMKQAKAQHKLQLELNKEAQKQEKEQKRLLREAEKTGKLRKKEESEKQKLLRKQQEEADKGQKQREKEEAELKRSNAIKKQASIMERFVKRIKPVSVVAEHESVNNAGLADLMVRKIDFGPDVATQSMDKTFASQYEMPIDEMRMVHVSSWQRLGRSMRSNCKQHWSIRRKPKVEFKELRLTTRDFPEHESIVENLNCGWEEMTSTEKLSLENEEIAINGVNYRNRKPQLLQFDKSCRPAFYGIWPKQSNCVGPRHPFHKDPDVNYDIDSDEEWEEEEPGESLSDIDKDDEEGLDQGCCKADEEESEDGFFVPDGYLSENEGVQVDRMEVDITSQVRTLPDNDQDSEDFLKLFKQQKFLNNLTECALRKNQPFIVNNTMHNKLSLISSEGLTGTQNLERTCLEALCIRPFPGVALISIEREDLHTSNGKPGIPSESASVPLETSDMSNAVSPIPSSSQTRHAKIESLQPKSPVTPVSHLPKTRKITDFMDFRLQTKGVDMDGGQPPVLTDDVGKHVSTFFSKRCLPPTDEIGEVSPETFSKTNFADQESAPSASNNLSQVHVFL